MVSADIAGMVAITPAAGFVTPLVSILIGAVDGLVFYGAMLYRIRKGLDESLDAWAIHGMGGLWGTIATGALQRWQSAASPDFLKGTSTSFR